MAAGESVNVQGEYYKVLGVPFDATAEDLKKHYHQIVRTLHPDRRRPGTLGGETLERFHRVQNAWGCLSDPTRRLLYDLRNFGYSTLCALDKGGTSRVEAEAKLLELQKQQAERDLVNMEVQLQKVVRREKSSRGILVKQAFYGDLRLRPESLCDGLAGTRTIEREDLVGPVLDVVTPLQCLVEQHTIVLPGGASSSKADLPGFYNPSPLDTEVELSLYVLYEFKGHQHEVFISDRETLSMPLRKHVLPAGKLPRGPFSPSNIVLSRFRDDSGGATAAGGQAGSADGARSAGGNSSSGGAFARAGAYNAAKALTAAVREYRLRRLRPPVSDPLEASLTEFKVVAMTTGVGLVIAVTWALSGRGSK